MAGIFLRNFWVTATRTVMTPAAGPVTRTSTIGSSIATSSRDPPAAPTRCGLFLPVPGTITRIKPADNNEA